MTNADFAPDLRSLEPDYQILTELNESAEARTYLARHLQLNRDVTITVVSAMNESERRALARFEADVSRLRTLRHPNVIPVIEGRRLGADQFAVVRARVRGSSLDQLVRAVGPIPQPRVGGMLDQLRSALDWARAHGISDRHVSDDTVIVQQGSGRLLLSFELAPGTEGLPSDACDDARTIGSLAWQMLSGQRFNAAQLESLGAMRPDLPSDIVAETNALVHCSHGGAVRDVSAYIARLRANEAASESPERATLVSDAGVATAPLGAAPLADSVRVEPPNPTPRSAPVVLPRRDRIGVATPAVVPVKSGWGFGARFAMGVAVLAVIALVAFVLMQRDTGIKPDRSAQLVNPTDRQAAGDVGLHAPPDSAVQELPTTPLATSPREIPSTMSATKPVPVPAPARLDSLGAVDSTRLSPPDTRRHEPPRTTPPVMFPEPAMTPTAPKATVPTASADSASGDACNSPAQPDQHRCLMRAIDENDVTLNAVYNRLITALNSHARANPDGADADVVERLRSVQRSWLDTRDQNCHTVGTGPLYARDRARCFANESARRTRELSRMLDSVNTPRPDSTSERGRLTIR